jgi:diguanylate cyclase (GGDEF)-like protein
MVYAGLSIVAFMLLWRADDGALMPYRRAVGVVLLVNALVLVLRASYMAWGSDDSVAADPGSVLVPVFLSAVLFYMALNVSLALLLFRRKEVHLRYLARHDALTGLLNRYSLDEYAAREVARANRGDHELSLIVLDLDDFKEVNDRYGHAAGDQVLVQAANRIHEVIREGDIAFRVGGEEFLVILPGGDREVAARVAERLRRVLVDRPFKCSGQSVTVSTSVGVVTFDPIRDDWESLLRRADQALYRAKALGRNRVEIGLAAAIEGSA